LRPLPLVASEPLPSAATARIAAGADTIDLTPVAGAPEVVTRFTGPSEKALRYGTTYAVTVTPWRDLIGNAGRTIAEVKTLPAPPLVQENGFEGDDAMVGGAIVVSAPRLPAINGTRSAAIATTTFGPAPFGIATHRFTARLELSPADTVVRLSVRPFSRSQSAFTYGATLLVAAPGGAISRATLPLQEPLSTQVTSTSTGETGWLGSSRVIEIPIPVGATSEVVVDFAVSDGGAICGLPPPLAGYLIDDVAAE
jgi:hypothetical protein